MTSKVGDLNTDLNTDSKIEIDSNRCFMEDKLNIESKLVLESALVEAANAAIPIKYIPTEEERLAATTFTPFIGETPHWINAEELKEFFDAKQSLVLDPVLVKPCIEFFEKNSSIREIYVTHDGVVHYESTTPEKSSQIKFTIMNDDSNGNIYVVVKQLNLESQSNVHIHLLQNLATGEWLIFKKTTVKALSIEDKYWDEYNFAKHNGYARGLVTKCPGGYRDWTLGLVLPFLGYDLIYCFDPKSENNPLPHGQHITDPIEKFNILIKMAIQLKIQYHDNNWMHGDLKPANATYIKMFRSLHIIDWLNIRKIDPQKPTMDFANGTPEFMAPEITPDPSKPNKTYPYTLAIDIFALGKIFYYLAVDWEQGLSNEVRMAIKALYGRMQVKDSQKRPIIDAVIIELKRILSLTNKPIKNIEAAGVAMAPTAATNVEVSMGPGAGAIQAAVAAAVIDATPSPAALIFTDMSKNDISKEGIGNANAAGAGAVASQAAEVDNATSAAWVPGFNALANNVPALAPVPAPISNAVSNVATPL